MPIHTTFLSHLTLHEGKFFKNWLTLVNFNIVQTITSLIACLTEPSLPAMVKYLQALFSSDISVSSSAHTFHVTASWCGFFFTMT